MKVAVPTVLTRSAEQIGDDKRHWAVIAGIALLALALRLYQLGSESLWTDELLSLGDADHLGIFNRHRPLFYIVLHRWCRVLSLTGLLRAGDAWVRLVAVFFGVAAVVLLYLLGRRLAGRSAATVACLIMAVAVPELDHSQEVRMYTMASALTFASLYALVRWIQGGGFWILGMHVLLTYFAFLTTPTVIFGLLLAGVMAAIWLVYRRKWSFAVSMLIGYGLLLAAWWPLNQYARMAMKVGHLNWIPRPTKWALLSLHNELLTEGLGDVRGFRPSPFFQTSVCLLVLLLIAAALVALWRQQRESRLAGVIAIWFYAIAVATYATSVLGNPVWILRYFHYTAPALYFLLGIGVVALTRWLRPLGWLVGAALVGLIAVAAADYYRLPMHEDWRRASTIVAKEAGSEDMVGIAGLQGLFTRYYRGRAKVSGLVPGVSDGAQQADALLADLLGQIPPHMGRTWIVVREDPRFQRVSYIERLEQYLRDRGAAPRIRILRSVQGQLDLVDFVSPVNM
jgi:mannosyltransferase